MLDTVGTALAYVVTMGLVAAPYWWLHALWRRRCVAAATRAAAELDGRYEPAASRRFSGGTIYGKRDGRDMVVDFFTGHSRKNSHTAALAILKATRSDRLLVRRKLLGGWDGADGLPPGARRSWEGWGRSGSLGWRPGRTCSRCRYGASSTTRGASWSWHRSRPPWRRSWSAHRPAAGLHDGWQAP